MPGADLLATACCHDSLRLMKAPLSIICAALAAITSVHAATTAELLKQLEVAANAEVRAAGKSAGKGNASREAEQLEHALAQLYSANAEHGNITALRHAVGLVQTHVTSEAAQKLAATVTAQLAAEATAQQEKRRAELEAVGKRCAEQGLAAKTAREIDAPLEELTRAVSDQAVFFDAGTHNLTALSNQLQMLTRFLQSRQDYFVKMEAGDLRQAQSALRQRGSVSDLGGLPWIPRSVLLATIGKDQKAAEPATDYSEATVKSAGAKILTAETAKELDPLISELSALNERLQNSEDGSERKGVALARSTLEFARRWQDFLAARTAGNLEKARSVLGELTGYGREYPGVPRSEILARAYGEDGGKAGGKKPAEGSATLASPEQILSTIKTLDDLDRILPEFTAATTGDRGNWSGIANDLQSIARSYRDLRAGNASRVSLGFSGSESKEPLATLRGQLAVFALPRILGVADADKPRPEENVLAYMRRMVSLARERQDWQFMSRILSTVQTTQVSDPLLKSTDSTALNSFLGALNLEKGRQYSLAVNSYQSALKTGSALIPAEEIGEHLDAIKRDHPADYEAGLQLTLTPPAPTTDAYGRPLQMRGGMPPGYPGSYPYPGYASGTPAKEQPVPVPAKTESSELAAKPAPPAAEPKSK